MPELPSPPPPRRSPNGILPEGRSDEPSVLGNEAARRQPTIGRQASRAVLLDERVIVPLHPRPVTSFNRHRDRTDSSSYRRTVRADARTLVLPDKVERWSLTTLREKVVKIGAKVIAHARYTVFQMAEVAVLRDLFRRT
jgi:hypothetical protein